MKQIIKNLPLNTFVIHKKFKPVHFSTKLKPLRIGPYKNIGHLSDATDEFLAQSGETFGTHRNHIFLYYPKEPIIFPHITKYQLLSSSFLNNPDSMSNQSHLSDTDITHPSSQSIINDNSPPIQEDMSQLTSNCNVPQHFDDSYHDSSYCDDMQDNPFYVSSSKNTQSQPTTQLQIFPRVAGLSYTFFPQSPRRN